MVATIHKSKASENNGKIVLTSLKRLIEELSGSLSITNRSKKKDIDEIIQEAKMKHFQSKKL